MEIIGIANPNDYIHKKKLCTGLQTKMIKLSGKKYAKDKWASDKTKASLRKIKEKRLQGYSILGERIRKLSRKMSSKVSKSDLESISARTNISALQVSRFQRN